MTVNNLQMNMLCRRVARLQARDKTMTVDHEASNAGHNRTQHTGTGQRGDADYLNTARQNVNRDSFKFWHKST